MVEAEIAHQRSVSLMIPIEITGLKRYKNRNKRHGNLGKRVEVGISIRSSKNQKDSIKNIIDKFKGNDEENLVDRVDSFDGWVME